MRVISRYYDNDEEVVSDVELQELVNELSADGKKGAFGGKGMVRPIPRAYNSYIERVSIECCITKTKVITLGNQKGRRQSCKPIKTRSNYT